jgi:hypothetical protein
MAATRKDVDSWIQTAKELKAKYIISVCDTFEWEDYPVYCKTIKDVVNEYDQYNHKNMQKVNEIIIIKEDGTVLENQTINTI